MCVCWGGGLSRKNGENPGSLGGIKRVQTEMGRGGGRMKPGSTNWVDGFVCVWGGRECGDVGIVCVWGA